MKEVVYELFSASWCSNCTPFKQTLDNIEGFTYLTVNVDNDPALTEKRGVRGLPTLIALSDDEVIGSISGNKSNIEVTNWMAGL